MNEFFISPIGKSLTGLVFIVVLLVIGNNLYQTQLSKTQKSVNTTVTYERKPAQTVLAIINISGFDSSNPKTIYTVTTDGTTYRSGDEGKGWKKQ